MKDFTLLLYRWTNLHLKMGYAWVNVWHVWNNAGILLMRTLGTNFNEMLSKMHTFSFKNMYLKMSFAAILSRPKWFKTLLQLY